MKLRYLGLIPLLVFGFNNKNFNSGSNSDNTCYINAYERHCYNVLSQNDDNETAKYVKDAIKVRNKHFKEKDELLVYEE